MNKYTYFVIQIIRDDGAQIAYVRRVANCNNLLSLFQASDGARILTINVCDGKKAAENIADAWNAASLEKGLYMLSNTHIYPARAY